jgi:CsoR family transcriptional regulator, copper-sensing transcriptional repressor
MDAGTKGVFDRRLARIEGQIAGMRRMVREDRYCVEILTLLTAVRGALDQLGAELVASHMKTCIMGRGSGTEHESCEGMSQEDLLEELRLTLSRLMR